MYLIKLKKIINYIIVLVVNLLFCSLIGDIIILLLNLLYKTDLKIVIIMLTNWLLQLVLIKLNLLKSIFTDLKIQYFYH